VARSGTGASVAFQSTWTSYDLRWEWFFSPSELLGEPMRIGELGGVSERPLGCGRVARAGTGISERQEHVASLNVVAGERERHLVEPRSLLERELPDRPFRCSDRIGQCPLRLTYG